MDARPLIALVTVLALTAVLYFGQDFLMPLALAVLIVFLLTPLVTRLECWGFSRVPAVVTVVVVAFSAMGLAVYLMTVQVIDLAGALPGYKDNLRAKASALQTDPNGPFGRLMDTFREVAQEFEGEKEEATERPQTRAHQPKPLPVELVNEKTSVFGVLRDFAGPVLRPLGTTALVIVFVVFMLLGREDLRDRFIHLIGRGRMRVTTQAIDDAGYRVSRYLAAQLMVNVTYGVPIGIGLYFIGVPNAALWGLLAIVFRFLPYIGPWIAASFPILLSFAVAPGWGPPALTIGLFVVVELISNNVVEPWLYGASTGLSPTAIIVSAAFWTWLWGAGGLLLATPLTVCVAVLGRHVPSLAFLDILLGERPPIAAEDRFYQRLLAGDETELLEIVEGYTERNAMAELYDEVIVPALRRAEDDFSAGVIAREERHELTERVCEALSSTAGFPGCDKVDTADVLLVPARNEADELAARMLCHLLQAKGIRSVVTSSRLLASEVAETLQEKSWTALCVSVLSAGSLRHAEALLRRLGADEPGRAFVGTWARQLPPTGTGGPVMVNSLADAARRISETAQLDLTPPSSTAAPASPSVAA